jgi:pepF/M3 family oligoendopeptidase
MAAADTTLPHWDLSNVYSGVEAEDFRADVALVRQRLDALDALIAREGIERLDSPPSDPAAATRAMEALLAGLNAVRPVLSTLTAYAHSFVTTDSYNQTAARVQSELEQLDLRVDKQMTRFQAWTGSLGPVLERICAQSAVAAEHHLVLEDLVRESRYLMSTELEDLAAELQLSGGGVMWKLQGGVTSQLKAPLEREGRVESLPITLVRNLSADPSEEVRRRAYEAEQQAYAAVRTPVAFALNAVKGAAVTLARRRGYEDVLHASLKHNRIDRPTLEALLGTIREYFPVFRRYLLNKAAKLGKPRLAWWDLAAPVGRANPTYTWSEASALVVEQFGRFSDELAAFAVHAFERRWIDAEPRDGKRGGAFCMRVPKVEESRILANFDGTFDGMITVAHELGHAFHNACQKGLPMLRRGAPMVLGETASIFCETLVFNAALETCRPEQQLGILENQLLGATQVTVDISSRFLFESEVVRRRAEAELSADDFCRIMLQAQEETYGEALDPEHRNPYMWLWKPHYYYGNLQFYNYPYAFGLLFGLGVYARYRQEGSAFIPRYKELLRSTGAGPAADLAARFGIDIRSRDFWRGSLDVIAAQVERYCALEA